MQIYKRKNIKLTNLKIVKIKDEEIKIIDTEDLLPSDKPFTAPEIR